jgi:hypothetical protein
MKPTMPMRMTESRSEILRDIARGKSDRWIACETHHMRHLIREVYWGVDSPNDIVALRHSLRAPRKVNNNLISKVLPPAIRF